MGRVVEYLPTSLTGPKIERSSKITYLICRMADNNSNYYCIEGVFVVAFLLCGFVALGAYLLT
jgi:hypothetical protein